MTTWFSKGKPMPNNSDQDFRRILYFVFFSSRSFRTFGLWARVISYRGTTRSTWPNHSGMATWYSKGKPLPNTIGQDSGRILYFVFFSSRSFSTFGLLRTYDIVLLRVRGQTTPVWPRGTLKGNQCRIIFGRIPAESSIFRIILFKKFQYVRPFAHV
jgi:hypothetical protein